MIFIPLAVSRCISSGFFEYSASLDRVEGRKIYVTGRSWCGTDLLAECEVVFIQPRTGDPVTDQIIKQGRTGGVPPTSA